MRHIEGPQTPFEVYCANCKVTFPIGTRKCLHCGARVLPPDRGRAVRAVGPTALAEVVRKRAQISADAGIGTGRSTSRRKPTLEELAEAAIPSSVSGPGLPSDDVDDMLPTRRFSPMTTIWILLAFTGAAVRACGGGG